MWLYTVYWELSRVVARIGTSAAGTSTNTGNERAMFPTTLCAMFVMMLHYKTYKKGMQCSIIMKT